MKKKWTHSSIDRRESVCSFRLLKNIGVFKFSVELVNNIKMDLIKYVVGLNKERQNYSSM